MVPQTGCSLSTALAPASRYTTNKSPAVSTPGFSSRIGNHLNPQPTGRSLTTSQPLQRKSPGHLALGAARLRVQSVALPAEVGRQRQVVRGELRCRQGVSGAYLLRRRQRHRLGGGGRGSAAVSHGAWVRSQWCGYPADTTAKMVRVRRLASVNWLQSAEQVAAFSWHCVVEYMYLQCNKVWQNSAGC